jgi:tRNA dimethylallyltransferase
MKNNPTKHLIYVAGPTASGKTKVAIALARWLKTEIISCDSRQFFKELKIGAAPPNAEELAQVKHHFIQNRSVQEYYNAGAFGRDAQKVLKPIFYAHDEAIMVGGSGLYANALMYGFDELPQADEEMRSALRKALEEKGLENLQTRLKEKDPEYYAKADIENPHRVMRALEVIESSGMKMSELQKKNEHISDFKTIILVMDWPREELYSRINKRVDNMVAAGLEEEAKSLLAFAHLQTLNTVGYKEWFAHFNGELKREETISLIKQNTRRFAKRQLTWFRRYKQAIWVKPDDLEGMKRIISEKVTNQR